MNGLGPIRKIIHSNKRRAQSKVMDEFGIAGTNGNKSHLV
ncbi:hypothetical protein KP78_38340 [Jeotgalibacillus soli]|uniref:Uncharacterized protein n=1 Tax=Jeotgalibacillus soli TaxID=889306 RepID=A0A0C2VDI4_9BACL|nr:hypothetical protein KP78_38340 [Jeotgalibacillus soli]